MALLLTVASSYQPLVPFGLCFPRCSNSAWSNPCGADHNIYLIGIGLPPSLDLQSRIGIAGVAVKDAIAADNDALWQWRRKCRSDPYPQVSPVDLASVRVWKAGERQISLLIFNTEIV
jgi:hypothetical protein